MLLVIKLLIELHMVGLGTFSYRCKIYLTLDLNSSSMITTSFLVVFKLLISTLATRKASQIWEAVKKRNATIVMLCILALQHLWFCHWLFTTIIFRWCKVQNGLGLRLGVIGSNQLNDGVDDGVLAISAPSVRLWHLFKTFLVACPFVAFKHSSTSSRCNVAFFEPFTFEVHIFNFFKMFHNQFLKVSSTMYESR
jgi:hypothetical protein